MKTPSKLAICGTLWLALSAAARADNLDAALYRESPKVMQYLRDHGYRNVGILKFRVQKGTHQPSFRVGPLNTNLPTRLENALVLRDKDDNPIGIIHDADKVAQDLRIASYTTDPGMARLFQTRFPLAWGDTKVQADAFLTGLVRVPANFKTATVIIQAFTAKSTKPDPVVSFTVETDRSLLDDLGQSFVLNSRSVKSRRTSRALDLEAAEESAKEENSPSPRPDAPSGDRPLLFEIRYDSQPQQLEPQGGDKYRVAEPQEPQKVTFYMKNVSGEQIGVVVMLNGKNTIYQEENEPVKCSMWILDAGTEYDIQGFQLDREDRAPFKVLSPEASEAMAYSDNLGLISVYVFRSSSNPPEDKNIERPGQSSEDGKNFGRSISLRKPLQKGHEVHARSLKERKQALAKAPEKSKAPEKRQTKRDRGVVDAGPDREKAPVIVVEFPNPEQQMAMQIRYYDPKRR
jgi:hypothetical protein